MQFSNEDEEMKDIDDKEENLSIKDVYQTSDYSQELHQSQIQSLILQSIKEKYACQVFYILNSIEAVRKLPPY